MKSVCAITLAVAVADATMNADEIRHAEECAAGKTIDCVYDSPGWSTAPDYGFGACSKACGPGTSTRTRTIIHPACNGGVACPATSQTEACMNRVCECEKVLCKYEAHTCSTYTSSSGTLYHDVSNYETSYDDHGNNLGALGLGDIGQHFPDNDEQYSGIDSRKLLRSVTAKMTAQEYSIANLDCTIVAQAPKLAAYLHEMKRHIASDLGTDTSHVNIKATTTEKLGMCGREEGIAAHAVVLLKAR